MTGVWFLRGNGAANFCRALRYFASAIALAIGAGATAQAADTKTFNIDAEPLAKALISLAAQADISIGLSGVNLTNRTSRDMVGVTTVEGALQRVLSGTGLGFEMVDGQTVRIFELRETKTTVVRRAEVPRAIETVPVTLPLVDEITVTAAKRPVSLRSIPLSIAVTTNARVLEYGLYAPNDATSMVAGVSSSKHSAGRSKLFVRGVSDGAFMGNTQSAVGLYIDETRATFNSPDPNLQLFDIERVEIIRGPQGTLYGAGPIGGLVRIITKRPTTARVESEITVDGGVSDEAAGSGLLQGMLNLPLIDDKLALRTVAYARHDGAYVRDTHLGEARVNKTSIWGARGGVRLNLSQDWAVDTGVIFQSSRDRDTQYFDGAMPALTRTNFLSEPSSNRFLDVYVTADGDLSWADLTSSTAYISQKVVTRYDASRALPFLAGLAPAPTAYDQDGRYETINHETRLASLPGSRVEWLAGAFVSHRTADNISKLTLMRMTPPSGVFYLKSRHDSGTELALFGEMTYALTPRLSVTGGLRLYRGVLNATANNSETIDVGPVEAVGANSKTGVTPRASVSYRINPDHLVYVQAAQGFRLGGVNIDSRVVVPGRNTRLTVVNFESDSLWNIEAGSKSTFFNQSLSVNASAFYSIWTDMQTDLTRMNGLSFTSNLGNVRNPGFEVEALYVPSDRLHLIANLGWSAPKLTQRNTVATLVSANRLPVVPKAALTLAAQYHHPISASTTGFANIKADFVGSARLTTGLEPLPSMVAATVVPAYQAINTRFGVERGGLKLAFYINNVLDNRENTYAFGNPFSLGRMSQVTPLRPRTFGINVNWTH